MAQGSLNRAARGGPRAAGTVVLLGGGVAEIVTHASPPSALLDWVVGAGLVAAALRHTAPAGRRDRTSAGLGLATAGAWFLATLLSGPAPAGMSPWWSGAASVAALAYRGPLLHWLARHTPPTGPDRVRVALMATGYAVALIGGLPGSVATAAVAATLAAWVALTSRRSSRPDDARRAGLAGAAVMLLLAAVWAASAGGLPAPVDQVLTALAMLATAGRLSRPAASGALTGAVGRLVLELGPTDRAASPVTASLARALADPDLRVYTFRPGTGWVDELGRTVPEPPPNGEGADLTQVDLPAGGQVVLRHGPSGAGDSDLARAAARAAGLALESMRVDAEAGRQADDVRESARRLVRIDDTEKQALADRLRGSALARLHRVRDSMAATGASPVLVSELDEVLDDLDRLAAGLAPAALTTRPLPDVLRDLVAGSAVPVQLELSGDVAALPENLRALVYYLCAEALTNVARHARAGAATVRVQAGATLVLDITDDGCGGATTAAGRGVQGLADRVALASGTWLLESPPGGPTRLRAEIPLDVDGPPKEIERGKRE